MSDEHTTDLPEEPTRPPAEAELPEEPTQPALEADDTQALPPVPEEDWYRDIEAAVSPASEQPAAAPAAPLAPEPVTVAAGSRIVLIVSSGPSSLPPAVPVEMPDISGEPQGAALLRLQDLGLPAQVLHDRHDRLPRGYVIGQHPAPGAGVHPGSEPVVVVSSGRAQLPAPDVMLPRVAGLHQTVAAEKLTAASLVPHVIYDNDPLAPPGVVLAQIPSEESLATPIRKRGSKLWLVAVAVFVMIAVAAGATWYLNRPTSIPNLVGLSQVQAAKSVELAGFTLGSVVTSQTVNEKEIGNVVGQAPQPGSTAAHGSTINLVVAGGQLLAPVPNVVGMPQANSIKSLQDTGLLFEVSRSYSSTVPSGSVISQAPLAGQKVPPGTTVGLAISMGAQTVTVPSVVGQLKTTAETALKTTGLNVATASNYDTVTPTGQVMAQQPTVGTGVAPGTFVGLTISRGAPPLGSAVASIPVVVGKSESKAKSALKSARLKSLVVPRGGSGRKKGEVVAQLPDAGAIVPRNSVVILFVSDGK